MSSVGDNNRCCKRCFESDIRDGNFHDVQLHIIQGHFRRELDAEPQFFDTCLLLAKNNARILNILFAATPPSLMVSPLILVSIIFEQLDNLDLLNRLFNLLKSQQYVLDKRDEIELLEKAIKIKAPIETFKILLSFGIDPNSYGALKSVVQVDGEWSNRVLQILLDGGADPNPQKICDQPLRFIILEILPRNESSDNNFMLENIKILLSAKAKPDLVIDNLSPFDNPRLVFIDFQMGSLIHIVASSKKYPLQERVLQMLIDGGAEVNAKDGRGRTPLMLMAASPDLDNFEFFKILVKVVSKNQLESKNLDLKNDGGYSVLHELAKRKCEESSKYMECVLEYLANPDVVNENGRTPLMCAVVLGANIKSIKLLIENGANLQIQDNKGFTVLHHACEPFLNVSNSKRFEIIQLLVQHGVNPNLTNNEGKTPLMIVSKYPENMNTGIIRLLIDAGTDMNIADKTEKNTVFHNLASVSSYIPFKDLKSLFERHESSLLLLNADKKSVFYYLTRKTLDDKDEWLHFLDFCKKNSKINFKHISRAIPTILYENNSLRGIMVKPTYFDPLLKSPFKIVKKHQIEVDIVLNKSIHMSFKLNFNFITALLYKAQFENLRPDDVIKCINQLESYGFDLVSSNGNCSSPLTALLLWLHRKDFSSTLTQEQLESEILTLAKYLIERGANATESRMTLTYKSKLYRQFRISDSLWLCLLAGFTEGVRLLLPQWQHPPLALLIYVLPVIRDPEFYQNFLIPLYPTLAAGGPLCIGSHIHREVKKWLDCRQDLVGNIRSNFLTMHGPYFRRFRI